MAFGAFTRSVREITDMLDRIVDYKRAEVKKARMNVSLSELKARAKDRENPRDFCRALQIKKEIGEIGLIAEIKKASPSKGIIRHDFNPSELAKAYEAGGATCISVLTDIPSFCGSPDYLAAARSSCSLPVLCKDFIVDPYQVYQARDWNADCILLIACILTDQEMLKMHEISQYLGMDVLIEVHNEGDLTRALKIEPAIIGINNRDLATFEVSLDTTVRLGPSVPADRMLVSESGIHSHDDCITLMKSGANAFLVGESLVRQPDVHTATKKMLMGR